MTLEPPTILPADWDARRVSQLEALTARERAIREEEMAMQRERARERQRDRQAEYRRKRGIAEKQCRPVVATFPDGRFYDKWDSAKAAAADLGVSTSVVYGAIQRGWLCRGLRLS